MEMCHTMLNIIYVIKYKPLLNIRFHALFINTIMY